MNREVGEAYEASTSALEAAKGQRLSLRRSIAALEEALAATHDPDGLGGQDALPARLGPALEHLQQVFAVHVEVTEAPGGLYQEILENARRAVLTVLARDAAGNAAVTKRSVKLRAP